MSNSITIKPNATPKFTDIVNVAAQSKESSHIRAKADGGDTVLYGYRKNSKESFFHKANPDRQKDGTLLVANSLDQYLQTLSPNIREKGQALLQKFVTVDGEFKKAMTNKDIVNISRQINRDIHLERDALRFADAVGNGKLMQAVAQNYDMLDKVANLVLSENKSEEVESALENVRVPELIVGVAINYASYLVGFVEKRLKETMVQGFDDTHLNSIKKMIPESDKNAHAQFDKIIDRIKGNDVDEAKSGIKDFVKFVVTRWVHQDMNNPNDLAKVHLPSGKVSLPSEVLENFKNGMRLYSAESVVADLKQGFLRYMNPDFVVVDRQKCIDTYNPGAPGTPSFNLAKAFRDLAAVI